VQGILGGARAVRRDGGTDGVAPSAGELLWCCDPELRTYWFSAPGDPNTPEAFRALGALLGHALLNRSLLPAAFPSVFYELLLDGLNSPRARQPTLSDLAGVFPACARSLERLIEYEGEDVTELFTLDWPRGGELTSENRAEHVSAFVQWFFSGRYAAQLESLQGGFRSVVGGSELLRNLVDAAQLEQILCGTEAPVDIDAIRSGAAEADWIASDAEFLEAFWDVLRSLTATEQRCFVTFVSACGRTPARGWQDLGLRIQKNGQGDERLPTAFTCFNLLLLPRYSSTEVLRARLRAAIVETEGFGLG